MRTLFATIFALAALVAAPALAQERNPNLWRGFELDGRLVSIPSDAEFGIWTERCSKLEGLQSLSCENQVTDIRTTWERAVNARATNGAIDVMGLNMAHSSDPVATAKTAYTAQLALQKQRPELFK